jgi:hypothetical protein
VLRARAASAGLRQESQLLAELAAAEERRGTLQSEIDALNDSAREDANELIHNAAAIFATLTKLYMDWGGLSDMRWDTVVIDEASMAMPPLVAYAAAHARKRVVIVGDPFQLPPVVHSGSDTEGGELSKDVFELRGVKDMIEEGTSPAYLATLRTQWRMHPDIVSVAKELISAYSFLETARGIEERNAVGIYDALNTNAPLITVDISGFHPWSGKMPGSLSRFNFVSAQACVEIASLYAASLAEPNENAAPPIGIVTPYAAQRRYLNKLIEMLNLGRWVMAGTVHTFQGNECDVIIFDSVLGEPHWTARLTNPFSFEEVKRDLNVALTRARHQFVFVGDSKWLRKNAKPASAYGKLWGYMEKHADHLDATELLGDGFRTRVAQGVSDVNRWTFTRRKSVTLLTETDFYGAFTNDLNEAKERVILYTPFIGTTRWPSVEPQIAAMRQRGVAVYLLHKPLSDPDWKRGNQDFGRSVFERLVAIGVKLIPISGVHAKTIVIDGRIVYEGSLNWASQTVSYEHMWRFESRDMAALVEKMLQLKPIIEAYTQENVGDRCPSCAGRLMLINQAQQSQRDVHPVKLGCYNHAEDKESCEGYLRRVDGRAPFLRPPTCGKGSRMEVHFSQSGKPWDWRCAHKGCKAVRWARGDCTG